MDDGGENVGGRLNWHRLFGLALTDYFDGTGYRVELEMDLSVKRQMLDVVVVRAEDGARLADACDGFEDLGAHNLLTYKSMRESLTEWSLDELVGHYVNYRKKAGLRTVRPGDVRLFAVTTRHPKRIGRRFGLEMLKPGVYNLIYGAHDIKVIVLPDVAEATRNALWELFSARQELVERGAGEYKFHIEDLSAFIDRLFAQYNLEGLHMPYTVEQFKRDYVLSNLKVVPAEEVLSRYKPEDRLAGLRPEQIEKWLASQKRPKRRRK